MLAVKQNDHVLFSGLLNAYPRCNTNYALPTTGHTALFMLLPSIFSSSSSSMSLSMMKALLKKGADPNALLIYPPEDEGTTPLHFTVSEHHIQASGVLLEFGANPLVTRVRDGLMPLDLLEGKKVLTSSGLFFVLFC